MQFHQEGWLRRGSWLHGSAWRTNVQQLEYHGFKIWSLLLCQPLLRCQHPFWSYFFSTNCVRGEGYVLQVADDLLFHVTNNSVLLIGETVFHFKHSIYDFITHHGAKTWGTITDVAFRCGNLLPLERYSKLENNCYESTRLVQIYV